MATASTPRSISSTFSQMRSMASSLAHLLAATAATAAVLLLISPAEAAAHTIGFEMHHRFSDRVREWAEARGGAGAARWPKRRSAEYYAALAHHDRALRGRFLAAGGNSSDELLAFAARGNMTFNIPTMGFLYYAFVEVGTPKEEFLVALDTGSHLFWLPCDCLQCAPTYDPNLYGVNLTFNIYSPGNSSTSRNILCSDSACGNTCPGSSGDCPYSIKYADGSATAGVLVQDILYLTTQDSARRAVNEPIILGCERCGRNQSGSFLLGGSPDGLFGLSMDSIAVPSVLASRGLIRDSFSMCFASDGVGRLNFGDKGSPAQHETSLDPRYKLYIISLSGIEVGNYSSSASFRAIADSGTSFTYLAEPMYSSLTQSFDSQVERRRPPDSNIPFEYCYHLSPSQTSVQIPDISFTTSDGSSFPAYDPIILLSNRAGTLVAYCLAVISSPDGLNIIGENFMSGLRIVFDRERLVLGWEAFDCFKGTNTSSSHVPSLSPDASSPPTDFEKSPPSYFKSPPPQALARPPRSHSEDGNSWSGGVSRVTRSLSVLVASLLYHLALF